MGEAFEGLAIVGPNGGLALVDVEAVVMPGEELVGLTGGNPLEFQQVVEDAVAEKLGELLATCSPDEVELVRVIKNTSGGETVDVGVISEVVAEGMNGEDDTSPAVGNSGLFPQPVLQGVGDEVAELAEALGLFTEDVAQNSGDGKNPVAMWDRQANFVADMSCGIEGATLVATRAASASLAGKGKQVMVVAVGTLDAKEAAGEITTAQAVAQCGCTGGVERAEVFGIIRVITRSERFE